MIKTFKQLMSEADGDGPILTKMKEKGLTAPSLLKKAKEFVSGTTEPEPAAAPASNSVGKEPAAPASSSAKTETPAATSSDKPVSVVKTKGGDYNVYAKGSEKAADFRKTYAAAKGNFEWEGRKYAKPSSETSKPATSTAAPLPPKRPEGLGTTSPGKVTLPSMDVGKPSSGPEFPKNKTTGTPTPPSRPETMNWTLSNRIGVRGNKAELSHDASAIGAYQRQKEYNSAENPKVPQVAPEPKPLDLNKPESESGGKRRKMSEDTNPLIASFLALQEKNPSNMFEAAKKAKKDYDGDGKVESPKDEVWGSRFKAAKKAGKMEEAAKPAVGPGGSENVGPAVTADKPKEDPSLPKTYPGAASTVKGPNPTSAVMSKIAKEEVEKESLFSQAEIDHINSFFLEASVAPNRPEVATGADSTSDKMSQNDVTATAESGKSKKDTSYFAGVHKEEYIDEDLGSAAAIAAALAGTGIGTYLGNKLGNKIADLKKKNDKKPVKEETLEEGRPKKNPEPETTDRDPRQHIQVAAGRAAAGNVVDFPHNNGKTSKITPGMGRRITAHLNGLKPADRQAAVNKMHDSPEGLHV